MERNIRSFTIIELLIVILILGALSVISVTRFTDVRARARLNTFSSNLDIIEHTLEQYRNQQVVLGNLTQLYPPALNDPTFKSMFTQEPINPYTNKSMLSGTSESGIQYATDGTNYKICITQADVDDINKNGITSESLVGILNIGSITVPGLTFTRNSVAYTRDLIQVNTNTPRWVPNQYGGLGLFVEDKSENLIVTKGHGLDWSKWSHWNNKSYWRTNTQYDDPVMGKVFQGTASAYTYFYDYYPYTVTASTRYTLSIYLKTNATITVSNLPAYIVSSVGGQHIIANSSKTNVTLTPEWQRFSWTLTPSETTASAGIGIGSISGVNNIEFYAAMPQFEKLPYATTWMGTQGTRAKEVVSMPILDKISMSSPWTIETIVTPNAQKMQSAPTGIDNYQRAVIWEIGDYYKQNQFSITLWKNFYQNGIGLQLFDNLTENQYSITLLPNATEINNPIYVVVRYDGNGKYALDAWTISRRLSTTFTFINNYQPADVFYVGMYSWDGGAWAGTIDDLRISDVYRTDAELQAIGTSRSRLSVDSNTVIRIPFDGSLQGQSGKVSQCSLP